MRVSMNTMRAFWSIWNSNYSIRKLVIAQTKVKDSWTFDHSLVEFLFCERTLEWTFPRVWVWASIKRDYLKYSRQFDENKEAAENVKEWKQRSHDSNSVLTILSRCCFCFCFRQLFIIINTSLTFRCNE